MEFEVIGEITDVETIAVGNAIRRRVMKKKTLSYVLCVKNDNYPASLEVRKIYRQIPDAGAAAKRFLRIVDESGEDYLFPDDYFVAIEVPKAAEKVFQQAS